MAMKYSPFPEGESRSKSAVRLFVAIGMVSIGVAHFVAPAGLVKIVPAWLPAPLMLVYVSGFFEIAGGIGVLAPRVRVAAAWGLIALYVAVFPANVNMAIHRIQPAATRIPDWALWGRLPIQVVLIAIAYWLTRPPHDARLQTSA